MALPHLFLMATAAFAASEAGRVEVYSVAEVDFRGPEAAPADSPARDVTFHAVFRHESGSPSYRVHGFWDGGGAYKIRFTPTKAGRWTLAEVRSNRPALDRQRQGDYVTATPSKRRGFWEADGAAPGRRWYRRSDGSHQYIFGNTHYGFLAETGVDGKPHGGTIAGDVRANARYFKKVRFSAVGDLYPHPHAAPFLDGAGRPTHSGDFSHRPNPAWFRDRVDTAVRTAFDVDLIADLILSGVDLPTGRSSLAAAGNGGDASPFLRYMAARYGAFPNVWFCLINEYDIKNPRYTPEQIIRSGRLLGGFLAYPSPVSVHRAGGPWRAELNTEPPWNDHVIIQRKLRNLAEAADALDEGHRDGGARMPVIDDELSYEGAGDRHVEGDTIESHLGAFLGGGYGTTGHKASGPSRQRPVDAQGAPVGKSGQYFTGKFDPAVHTAADNLGWLRERIDSLIEFWRMQPAREHIFTNLDADSRVLAEPGRQYALGVNKARSGIRAALPAGRWKVTLLDAMRKEERVVHAAASGETALDAPDSRAALYYLRRLR